MSNYWNRLRYTDSVSSPTTNQWTTYVEVTQKNFITVLQYLSKPTRNIVNGKVNEVYPLTISGNLFDGMSMAATVGLTRTGKPVYKVHRIAAEAAGVPFIEREWKLTKLPSQAESASLPKQQRRIKQQQERMEEQRQKEADELDQWFSEVEDMF